MSGGEGGWANPLPAGLVSLAVAVFIFGAMFFGYTGDVGSPAPVRACWLFGAAIIQLTVAVIELKEGALNGGNVFLFFGAFFCFTTALDLFTKYILTNLGWAFDAKVDGWAWLALGITLIPVTFCYMKKAPLSMNLMVFALDFAVVFICGMDGGWISKAAGAIPAGWGCFIAGFFALYTVAAVFLNDNFERTVLPMPGPIFK